MTRQELLYLPPRACRTGGLDALVETGKVGKLAAVVAESAHEPVPVSTSVLLMGPIESKDTDQYAQVWKAAS